MWKSLRRIFARIALTVFGLQIATVIGLLFVDARRKKNKAPTSFPRSSPREVDSGLHHSTVYTYGNDAYDAMIDAIDSATESVRFETFIWKTDASGQRFRDAFVRAADRGVRVELVWDAMGKYLFTDGLRHPEFFDFDDHPNIHTRSHPLLLGGLLFWHPRNHGANHRKILTVDHRVGFIGGYNIGDNYATDWRDTHVRIQGPAVLELENAFVDYWNLFAPRAEKLPAVEGRSWEPHVNVVRNVPRQRLYPIRSMYLENIDRASERIWMTHAYFIPDVDLVRALTDAVARGVDVRIILPHRSNHIVADWVSRGSFRALLAGGVRIFWYEHAMVHAKTSLIDDTWTTIGTANLDPLSLRGNYEINLSLMDDPLNDTMADIFDMDLDNCTELTLDAWEKRPFMVKFSEAILKPFSPFL